MYCTGWWHIHRHYLWHRHYFFHCVCVCWQAFSVDVGYERFLGPEIFFHPEFANPDFTTPISEAVDTVIQNCPIDVRRPLYKVNTHNIHCTLKACPHWNADAHWREFASSIFRPVHIARTQRPLMSRDSHATKNGVGNTVFSFLCLRWSNHTMRKATILRQHIA